ncbi:DUF3500 domain-containing protein [Mycolicibacterium palauense]|uniref:DUF3500 domain-containing protein n=1 Tax=Mycolicibacterium palauense TaxID=2034511 RepID=UPI000BFEFEEE|nr:DUF3500 domain-containing protein [Mycolicibacterium palauense]
MRREYWAFGSFGLAVALVVGGCTSDSPSATSPTLGTSSAAAAGSPSGGPGDRQPIAAVDLNTDGVSPGGANTADVVAATNTFLALLDQEQRDTVEYDFSDSQARQTWSNYPAGTVPREGIALADLTSEQLDAAYAVLKVALSGVGYQQDRDIQAADDFLAGLGGRGADMFSSVKDYFIAVYGKPSEDRPFMVQFGGHHLARNLTYNGDDVSQTPQFVGSEPTSFDVDGVTVRPVGAESSSMFAMIDALTDRQRGAAEITSGTFDDLLMGPGKDSGTFPTPEGLPVSDLDATQRAAVLAAIRTYVGDLSTDAATRLLAEYQSELDDTRIGWSNNSGPTDENSYIRIDGPSVWIEFINTRSNSTPNIHYHSVYRDKNNDYGSSKPS